MYFSSLLINRTHPCWINLFLKKNLSESKLFYSWHVEILFKYYLLFVIRHKYAEFNRDQWWKHFSFVFFILLYLYKSAGSLGHSRLVLSCWAEQKIWVKKSGSHIVGDRTWKGQQGIGLVTCDGPGNNKSLLP